MSKKRMMILADGASIHTVKWIQGLSLRGDWELYLVSMNPAPFHERLKAIPELKEMIQCAPRKIKEAGNNYQYLFQVPKILSVRKRINPHVINSVYLTSYGFVAALIKGPVRLCHFTIGDDIMLAPDRNWFFNWLTRFTLSKAELVVSASQTMTDKMVHRWSVAKNKILTQQYGLSDWVLGYPQKEKVYDFVSNRMWVPNSNIDWMLSLVAELSVPFRLALIGNPVKGGEELGEKILAICEKTPGVVKCGSLPYEQNIEVIAQSRFLFSVTASDGASISLLEAMALGAIPIVSDTAPNREWIRHGENGFLVPLNDRAAAARIVAQAMNTAPEEVERMRKINFDIIQSRGSLRKNMTKLLDVLDWPTPNRVASVAL